MIRESTVESGCDLPWPQADLEEHLIRAYTMLQHNQEQVKEKQWTTKEAASGGL